MKKYIYALLRDSVRRYIREISIAMFLEIQSDIYIYIYIYYVIQLKFVVHVFNLKSAAFLMLETVQNRGARYVYL